MPRLSAVGISDLEAGEDVKFGLPFHSRLVESQVNNWAQIKGVDPLNVVYPLILFCLAR